jgi:hypothetical protein
MPESRSTCDLCGAPVVRHDPPEGREGTVWLRYDDTRLRALERVEEAAREYREAVNAHSDDVRPPDTTNPGSLIRRDLAGAALFLALRAALDAAGKRPVNDFPDHRRSQWMSATSDATQTLAQFEACCIGAITRRWKPLSVKMGCDLYQSLAVEVSAYFHASGQDESRYVSYLTDPLGQQVKVEVGPEPIVMLNCDHGSLAWVKGEIVDVTWLEEKK